MIKSLTRSKLTSRKFNFDFSVHLVERERHDGNLESLREREKGFSMFKFDKKERSTLSYHIEREIGRSDSNRKD